ncbi:hypothetical protein GCM10023115_38380 [Pontixanthobacter gangjinensis]
MLYLGLSLFFIQSYVYFQMLKKAIAEEDSVMVIVWLVSFIFSFIHIFLVLMDGWSRFQNYKRIKDQFYVHGFDVRLAANFEGSKCQRQAALVAATELGMDKDLKKFFRKRGVRYYHFIPYFMIRDPFFPFKRYFWSRTFLEKAYTPKFDYRQISAEQELLRQGLTNKI